MIYPDIELYKELINFCQNNQDNIETKFKIDLKFDDFHERCFIEMYLKNRDNEEPLKPIEIKKVIPELTEVYKKAGFHFMRQRNKMIKGLDIQKGQWFEKAFQLYLSTKGIVVNKKGFPYPDYVVEGKEKPKAFYELKYIEAPFLSADKLIKEPYPYKISRYDYEASLTLDTGEKLATQRKKIEEDILTENIPAFYVWWFDAPHLKGIFFMEASEVFSFWDEVGNLHERKQREGDLLTKQEKGKIYPPLLKMKSLSDFINLIK
ncbi:MAG: hypothetical protein ACO1OO_09590 [Flavisolibacter sp.]